MRAVFIFCIAASSAVAQPPMTDVVVAQAEMRELPSTVTLVATVEPWTRSLVGSETAGLVVAMHVRQGDVVKKGDILLELDTKLLELDIAEAQARVDAAKALVKRWAFELSWMRDLRGEDKAGQIEFYRTEAEFGVAEQSARERQAIVDRLKTDLEKSRIRAPFDGFVVMRHTEVGEWLERGGNVVEIIDLTRVLVRVDVHERSIPFIRKGDTARVRVEALQDVFEGRIRHIIRQADPAARTFPVEIEIDNHENQLAAGMFARATVTAGEAESVVAVPKDAIYVQDGIEYVGMVFPGERGMTGMLKAVTTGKDVADWIAITSKNVAPGMNVVVRGNERMMPFPAPVRVVDEFGTPVETPKAEPPSGGSRGGPPARRSR